MRVKNFWTQGKNYLEAREHFNSFVPENTVIVSYAAEAEASAFISMGIDPLRFKWIDLHVEVKMLYNHNNLLVVGDHIKDGRVVSIRPKVGEYGGIYVDKAPTSLASALYRFLKVKIDSDHKNKMRDIILSHDDALILKHADDIMRYCESDTKYLPRLFDEVCKWLKRCVPSQHQGNLLAEMFLRGEYSVRTAIMVRHGYPINVERCRNLASNTPHIISECARDINSQFPELKPFKFNLKQLSYTLDTKVVRDWVKKQDFSGWIMTDTGMPSLSLEAWEKFFPFRHEYPRGNLGAQMLRYLKILQSLRSFNFKAGSETKTFFEYLGSDGMCRPYLNSYGAQSSRFQPASTGFLFLKPAFLRSLCYPPKGWLMGSIDYSSQEFLLAALLSVDQKMVEAYRQGDVYLYFAKESGMVPKNATKESHKRERDLAKSTVLGISYSMTNIGLSRKLTSDTGQFVSEAEAQKYIDNFNRVFSTFYNWKQEQLAHYKAGRVMRLPDGWIMFQNNPNDRSVTNMPIQGMGAAILRKAIAFCQDSGLNVVAPLHDSLYIMFEENDLTAMDKLANGMVEAFCHFFPNNLKDSAKLIRLEAEVWGPGANKFQKYATYPMPLTIEDIHIDVRGKKEYEAFQNYFDTKIDTEML